MGLWWVGVVDFWGFRSSSGGEDLELLGRSSILVVVQFFQVKVLYFEVVFVEFYVSFILGQIFDFFRPILVFKH